MTTHRFTVNVPNPTASGTTAQLSLEPAQLRDIGSPPLDVPAVELAITRSMLALDPCGDGRPTLSIKLAPYSSVDVHITVDTADPPDPRVGGVALVHLVDRRRRRIAGGVLLGCLERPNGDSPGRVIPARGGCPVELAELYASADPVDPTAQRATSVPVGAERTLVAVIRNPTTRRLGEVTVYLEHLGLSNAQFAAQVWHVGTLPAGEVFYATWSMTTTTALVGPFDVSIVVASNKRLPVRLKGRLTIARHPRKPKRGELDNHASR